MRLMLSVVFMALVGTACGDGSGPADTGLSAADASPGDAEGTGDAGAPLFDAGVRHDGGDPPMDGGPPPDGGACAELPEFPPSLLPRCTVETRGCIESCRALPRSGQMTCMGDCIASDTMPADRGLDCNACMVTQLIACWNRQGCSEQTGAFLCCLDACEGTDTECASGECSAETATLAACIPDECTYYESPITTVCLAGEGE